MTQEPTTATSVESNIFCCCHVIYVSFRKFRKFCVPVNVVSVITIPTLVGLDKIQCKLYLSSPNYI